MSSVGHAPSKPQRLARGDWVAVFKRTAKEFLDDDCMGLAQQIAYSSLLAFFPAVVALIGLLDLVNAYGALRSFLDPVAPTPPARTKPADAAAPATRGSFDFSLPPMSAAPAIEPRSSSTADASRSRSASMSFRSCSSARAISS